MSAARKRQTRGGAASSSDKKAKPTRVSISRDKSLKPLRANPFQVKITQENGLTLYTKLRSRLPTVSLFSYDWFLFTFGGYWYDEVEERMLEIERRVSEETDLLCPPAHRIWRWAELIPDPMQVRVVVCGQDPYTSVAGNTQMADGLAFSVSRDYYAIVKRLPPSLGNILRAVQKAKESDGPDGWLLRTLAKGDHTDGDCSEDSDAETDDYGPRHGNLDRWAKQGVLLINNVLTAPGGKAANSHKNFGWQFVTDAVVRRLGSRNMPHRVFFMLWGRFAKDAKLHLIHSEAGRGDGATGTLHYVFQSHHPSPMSVNHMGEFPHEQFVLCNKLLAKDGKKPITWW